MIDELKVFRGGDIEVNSHITIHHPTLGEVCEYGEQRYFGVVHRLCATPADMKVELWDSMHVYWDSVSEYDLFLSNFKSIPKEDLAILLPGIDPEAFELSIDPVAQTLALKHGGIVVDMSIHKLITDTLRRMHGLTKNIETGYDDFTRDCMIEDDKLERESQRRKGVGSQLLPMISAMTNTQGFKYRHDDVWSMPIFAFMDAVARVQKIKSVGNLMMGIYSGSIDSKKISNKDLDWMGELKKHS